MKQTIDFDRLRADLRNTAFNAWFDCGDKHFPQAFSDEIKVLVDQTVEKVAVGFVSLEEAYSKARHYAVKRHVEFYNLD